MPTVASRLVCLTDIPAGRLAPGGGRRDRPDARVELQIRRRLRDEGDRRAPRHQPRRHDARHAHQPSRTVRGPCPSASSAADATASAATVPGARRCFACAQAGGQHRTGDAGDDVHAGATQSAQSPSAEHRAECLRRRVRGDAWRALLPASDDMITRPPRPRSTIGGRNRRASRTSVTPLSSTARTRSASSRSRNRPIGAKAAFVTSSPTSISVHAATRASTPSTVARSVTTVRVSTP